jgi:serine protease Do
MIRKGIVPTLAVLALAAVPASARADDTTAVRRAVAATVRILTGSFGPEGQFRGQTAGSGVIISPDGLALTNHHVVFPEGGNKPFPQIWAGLVDERLGFAPPSRAVRLKFLAADPTLDLALLEIQAKDGRKGGPYPFLPMGSTAELFYGSRLRIVGFPGAGGPTTTVVETTVLGMDEEAGWIKVDGGIMRGVSGGAALNERGELVGVPTQVQADQEVPFLGDGNVPMGTVVLGTVGYVRSVEAARGFLRRSADGTVPGPEAQPLLKVKGVVIDKESKKPVQGAVIGLLTPQASAGAGDIDAGDLLAYSRSGADGGFVANRGCRPGSYLVKVVHPQYKTLVRRVSVDANNTDFEVTLQKE